MKQVSVWYQKDGDHLRVVEVPFWLPAYERVVDHLFCPCCGISGFLSRMEWYEVRTYRVWNRLLGLYFKFEKELIKVPVESGCVVSLALCGDHKDDCWRDDCPVK